MANKKQEKAKAALTKGKKGKKQVSWRSRIVTFLLIAAAVVLLQQTIIMVVIGMLPAIVAYIVDDTRSRAWSKVVTACNMAGMLPFVVDLYFVSGNSTVAMQQQMSSLFMWMVVYGSAGIAWVLIWGMPKVALFFYRIFHAYRIDEHKKALRKLRREWGMESKKKAEDTAA